MSMRIPDWLVVVTFNAAILGGGAFLLWMGNQIIDIWDTLRRRKQFDADLRASLAESQPSWEKILDFASLRGLSRTQTNLVLRVAVRDALTGKSPDMKPHLPLLESYLASHRSSEPFEGMPNEIRMHLERLREHGPEAERLLEPLTTQIRDLLALKSREYTRQRLYTVGGFLLGVVGLLFAGFTYLYPPEPGSISGQPPAASGK